MVPKRSLPNSSLLEKRSLKELSLSCLKNICILESFQLSSHSLLVQLLMHKKWTPPLTHLPTSHILPQHTLSAQVHQFLPVTLEWELQCTLTPELHSCAAKILMPDSLPLSEVVRSLVSLLLDLPFLFFIWSLLLSKPPGSMMNLLLFKRLLSAKVLLFHQSAKAK